VIDALDIVGGQCAALYPEKPIYDIPGYPRIAAMELVDRLSEQAAPFSPHYHLGQRVESLVREGEDWVLTTSAGTVIRARAVVIAAGVGAFGPNRPPMDRLPEFEGKSVFYLVKRREDFRGKRVVIAGGGDSAVDWALNLQDTARHITLIHRRNEFRAHESTVNQMMASPADKLEVLTPWEVRSVHGGNSVEQVVLFHNGTQEERSIPVDAVLLNLGFKADIGPIKEWGLKLDKRTIVINERTETNLPGVYAAGDIAAEAVKMNLIATCYGQAALAVNVAKNYIDPRSSIFPGHSSEKMEH
jgi:thioredoxin reductase (NADPH)